MKHPSIMSLIISSIFFLTPGGFAQTEESDSGPAETESQSSPDASDPIINIQEQPYKYYYWPDEDLNNFGLSSMGSGKTGTTLGSSSERKSNLEVNAPGRPEKRKESEPGSPEEGNGKIDSTLAPDYDIETIEPPGDSSLRPASESPIYKWVDDQGTLHITNNIGDVPLKYQEEYYNREEITEE